MHLWGLTGSIASGKSTVSKMFTAQGATVLDADALYHQLLIPQRGQPSPLVVQIAAKFKNVVQADGSLDRQQLGAQIFADHSARQTLNDITHPAIAEAFAQQVQHLREQGIQDVIYDVPLLFENQMQRRFVAVILVWVDAARQEQRLMQRNQISQQEARRRIRSQMPLDIKKTMANFVIDNNGSSAQTQAQVKKIWSTIQHYPR